jgi:hypothetical protein
VTSGQTTAAVAPLASETSTLANAHTAPVENQFR